MCMLSSDKTSLFHLFRNLLSQSLLTLLGEKSSMNVNISADVQKGLVKMSKIQFSKRTFDYNFSSQNNKTLHVPFCFV